MTRRRPFQFNAGKIAVWLILFLSLLKVPATGLRTLPPQSWEPVLCYSSAHYLQWGVDIVFTYGPLGFLGADYYWGYLLWPTVLWGVWFAVVMTQALMRLSGHIYRPIAIALLVAQVLTPPVSHFIQDVIGILAVIVLVLECFPSDEPPRTRLVLTGMTLAVLGDIKFTFFVLGVVCCIMVGVAHLWRRRWDRAIALAASFAISFFALWLAVAQHLSNLPVYFRLTWQMAKGYDDAMGIECSGWILGLGLSIGVIAIASLGFYWLPRWRNVETWLRTALLGAALFLGWKESYVRADAHVLDWFLFAIFFVPMTPALLRVPTKAQFWSVPASIIVLLVSLIGITSEQPDYCGKTASDFFPRLGDVLTAILAPPAYQTAVADDLTERAKQMAPPDLAAKLGGSKVDAIGYGQDLPICLGLNYTPHPLFQEYFAFTPEFQQMNLDFFNSSRAPDYVFWNYMAADGRYPTLEDGALVVAIPRLYTPIFATGNNVLWKRNETRTPLDLHFETQKTTTQFGKPLELQPGQYWLKVNVQPTLLGKIRSFFYRPAQYFITVQFTDQTVHRFRLIPGNASYGFLVQPCIATMNDLLQYSHDGTTAHVVRAFSVDTKEPALFEPDVELELASVKVTPP